MSGSRCVTCDVTFTHNPRGWRTWSEEQLLGNAWIGNVADEGFDRQPLVSGSSFKESKIGPNPFKGLNPKEKLVPTHTDSQQTKQYMNSPGSQFPIYMEFKLRTEISSWDETLVSWRKKKSLVNLRSSTNRCGIQSTEKSKVMPNRFIQVAYNSWSKL